MILAAAGSGSRFGGPATPTGPTKVEEDLGGRPVFAWSLALLRARAGVVSVVLAVDPRRRDAFAARWPAELADAAGLAPVRVVAGGADRDATVRLALAAVPEDATHAAVHDAARPGIDDALLDRLFAAAAAGHDAVFPGVPVADTLRRVQAAGGGVARAGETVDRESLVAVQTPQLFAIGVLRRAHAATLPGPPTDDAGRVAALGVPVVCVPGDPRNVKLTTRADLATLEARVADAPSASGPPGGPAREPGPAGRA
ncbi:2-C-methyl-D-erythritol 4-phosphate cytidylyltransferase [Phycisphaera mikurensis NBRC 102666]|uniref:2-C-methyl-D-erythritol 4-phosphate cytidylyltransferase n=1 Tax=Phycisphaera mikurensis (strain NBRC 102666 / KCTC 22515 / FYK2301M01) TaxID=1142394 RepID=I0IDU0_PHYMF|nr:2-C-methyl-D-erythritol 4-phosphate cytidylyltransferase [Phycisphaera mikurensis NBRC 102666]